jgi:hypothetical protein
MAETETKKNHEKIKAKIPFGKKFWIGNLVIDSLVFGLNTGAVVYATVQHKKGNIKPEGDFLIGTAVGLNAAAMMAGAGSIARDIKRIHQISKAEKETGCSVSAAKYTVLMTHESNGAVKSVDIK